MAATNGYRAKAALIAALQARAALVQAGNALYGVQVLYAFNASKAEATCVYGGGIVTDQPGEGDLHNGRQRLAKEIATIGVHVRVTINPTPEAGIQDSDTTVRAILDEIAAVIEANPTMGDPHGYMRVAGLVGDYSPNDDAAISTGSLRIEYESYVE